MLRLTPHVNVDVTLDEQHKSTSVTLGEKKTVLKTRSPKYIQQTLKEATGTNYKQIVSPGNDYGWAGKHTWHRTKCTDEQQLIPIKVYRVKQQKEQVLDSTCALGHSAEETLPNLLCGGSAIVQTIYKVRHDRMFRPIYHLLLSVHEHGEWRLQSVV